jgi:hypothetical protein
VKTQGFELAETFLSGFWQDKLRQLKNKADK